MSRQKELAHWASELFNIDIGIKYIWNIGDKCNIFVSPNVTKILKF